MNPMAAAGIVLGGFLVVVSTVVAIATGEWKPQVRILGLLGVAAIVTLALMFLMALLMGDVAGFLAAFRSAP